MLINRKLGSISLLSEMKRCRFSTFQSISVCSLCKMGCSNSKTESKKTKKMEPLHLCKERKRFVKQAMDSRCALAAAHVSYTCSLPNIGVFLRQYSETETVEEEEEEEEEDDSVNSPLSHNSPPNPSLKPNAKFFLNLSYMKTEMTANSAVTFTINPMSEGDGDNELEEKMSRSRRPEKSSWDYFDDFDSEQTEIDWNVAKCGSEKVETTTMAFRDLGFKQEQRKQSFEGDEEEEEEEDESGNGGEREDPSEFITHRAKDFVSSMKDIEHKFFKASESGREVSRMLEANKIRVGFVDMTGS